MKALLSALAVALLLTGGYAVHDYREYTSPWSQWQAFSRDFISKDGRVIDRTAGSRSTSEGQAYGLFFALAANDRAQFDNLLRWTRDNLAQGDLDSNLPAWLWGEDKQGNWTVVDANAASDADLWMAYALLEAARLWQAPAYADTARALLRLVAEREVLELPASGRMLMPGPVGFYSEERQRWRLNPSYLPEFQFRYLSAADPAGPWQEIWSNHVMAMRKVIRIGVAPDWYELDGAGTAHADTVLPPSSSYDAIRVYLWAGMSAVAGAPSNEMLELTAAYRSYFVAPGLPPERVHPDTGVVNGGQPLGFSAAVLPYLRALNDDTGERLQQERLDQNRVNGSLGSPAHYYDQVLALFGEGWAGDRFRFDAQGQLIPRWQTTWLDTWLP